MKSIKEITQWVLFIIINFLFYVLAFGILNPPGPQCDLHSHLPQKIELVTILIIFLYGIVKFPRSLPRNSKLMVSIFLLALVFSLVAASLNSARVKSCDSKVKSAMSLASVKAREYFNSHSSFLGICLAKDGPLDNIKNAAQIYYSKNKPTANSFAYNTEGTVDSTVCHDDEQGWAAISALKNPILPGTGWCIDSTGAPKEAKSLDTGVIKCP